MAATGEWPKTVEINCGALRILDIGLPKGDPLLVTFAGGRVVVQAGAARWSCVATVNAPPFAFRALDTLYLRPVKTARTRKTKTAAKSVDHGEQPGNALRALAGAAITGVEADVVLVELWKIGDSPAAPRFNVVCKPNEWEATVDDAKDAINADEANRSQKLRIRYWTAFREYLREHHSSLRAQKPSRDHWYSFGIGTSRAHTAALLITRDNNIAVGLTIDAQDAKDVFRELCEQKEAIEKAVGEPLEWREMPDKKASRVVLFKSADGYKEETWPEQFAWLREKLEMFDKVFRPLLAKV